MNTTIDELTSHVQRANRAFEAARSAAPSTRAGWLEAIAVALGDQEEPLIQAAALETHLPAGRLAGELKRTIFQLRLFADEILKGEHFDATIDEADANWGMGPRPDLRRLNVPLGVVGVFGASNFPFAFSVIGGDSASALAAGCAVVHKAHDAHLSLATLTGEIVTTALAAAGAPTGLFALVSGREAAGALIDHPLVKAIGFTGSTAGGRALFDRANRRPEPIPFFGELGGINAVVVSEGTWKERREETLHGYVDSFTLGMGQFCTKPGLLLIPSGDTEEVRRTLSDAVAGVTPGRMLSDNLQAGYVNAVKRVRSSAAVDVLVEGDFTDKPKPTLLHTTAAEALTDPGVLTEEMFGPASVIVEYTGQTELLDVIQALEGQLTTTVHAEPGEDLSPILTRLADISGRVIWNSWPTGVTVSFAQHHGGPYPATTSTTTSVGTAAVRRFLRPVAYQGLPQEFLPEPVRSDNPWNVPQRINGVWVRPYESETSQ
ncbi:aldehyde dehydrogenase (NADP(+)) [Paenarthrobacter sp. AB444]|uniref:aldehyde dehydrogenase (NADP(+)) n=1 Tax=Paenarthrobacter sp. AB444 TaxID=3025681 RepID=UPI00236638F4|nr:aldehyde dehydrogenase (NADP(+)) [Paenarthrobacter sp. AB444]MDD7833886.1 aldehyde dehydrogenase (NADP(+)) [Paenarthrobacter sp. AB444]